MSWRRPAGPKCCAWQGRRCRVMLHACYVRLCGMCTVGRVAPTLHIMGEGARSNLAVLEVQQQGAV